MVGVEDQQTGNGISGINYHDMPMLCESTKHGRRDAFEETKWGSSEAVGCAGVELLVGVEGSV